MVVFPAGQLILPDALKLLPLYALALMKSIALRTDVKPDDRSVFLSLLFSLPCSKVLPLFYGRLISLNHLRESNNPGIIPPAMSLSSEHLKNGQLFLLENGHEILLKAEANVRACSEQQNACCLFSEHLECSCWKVGTSKKEPSHWILK